MANTFKFGAGKWAAKAGSVLAYNDENNNFKPLPFTFTRASTATRVNESGLIESVSNGVPRIDYLDNADGHLLLEPSRTNLQIYSQDFSQGWIASNITIGSASAISPDGSLNAFNIKSSIVNGGKYIYYDNSVSTSTTYTLSGFFKKKTHDFASLLINQRTSGLTYIGQLAVNIDLVNGLIGTQAFATAPTLVNSKIENYGNGWYRVSLTATTSSDGAKIRACVGLAGSTSSFEYSGTILDEVYCFGIQLEAGSYATSYIPTSGAAVTRTADVANNAGNAQVFNDSEGVLFVETKGFYDADLGGSSTYIQLSKSGESSFNNSLVLQHRNNGYLRVYVNGSATENIHFNEDIDFTQNHKIAVLYKLNGYKLFIDGLAKSLYLTPTQTVFSGLNNLSFDSRGATSWNGSIKDVRVYNTTLSDSELISLTSL